MSIEALKRPFSAKALPGLLLVIIPIINFFAMGYKMACARTAMSGRYELPQWKNWKQLFAFGAIARSIQAIWFAPAIICFFILYVNAKAATAPDLATFISIKNLFIELIALLALGAVFSPASVMNYVAEARFKSAFSFSMFRRMFSKAYAIGWLISGFYAVIVALLLVAALFAVGLSASMPATLVAIMALLAEMVLLWLPGITYWTLLGEYWGKSINREYQTTQ